MLCFPMECAEGQTRISEELCFMFGSSPKSDLVKDDEMNRIQNFGLKT
jgi:hypothetical protein